MDQRQGGADLQADAQALPVEKSAGKIVDESESPEGPFEDQALLQALETSLPGWLGDQSFIIVPERKLRDMTGLDIPLVRFHEIMYSFRRDRALPKYALSFTRNPDEWRISHRK